MAQRKASLRAAAASASPELLAPALCASEQWFGPQEKYFRTEAQLVRINGEVTGRFNVGLAHWRYGFPLASLVSLKTPLTFAGTPHIRKASADLTLEAFLLQDGVTVFALNVVPADGPFWDVLTETASRLKAPVHVLNSWKRAALDVRGDFAAWFETNFERKRRKELKRLRARLSETGNLASLSLAANDRLETWIDEFVALEERGWKGRSGTAIAANPDTVKCLKECLRGLHDTGNLRFWKLALDGKPLAMMFAMTEGRYAWLGKIAFDEDFARFSPGVLLILDATAALMADPAIDHVDSCAITNHPMIDRLWRDRLLFCDVLIGRPGMSPAGFALVRTAEKLRRGIRNMVKRAYYRLSEGRPS